MQIAHIRVASFALPVLLIVAACGQVTGLSDDYEFDLVDGGAASNDAASNDAARSDADAGAKDAASRCSNAQTASVQQRLTPYKGAQACKTCLASSCCADVDSCAPSSDCNRALSCKLECTEKSAERTPCFRTCTLSGGGEPPLFTNGVGECSARACKTECGFQ